MQMHQCATGSRSLPFVVHRQRSPRPRQVRCLRPKRLPPPQRTRGLSRHQYLLFSTGTWRHLLWQIDQRTFNALRAALAKCLLGRAQRRCTLRVSTVVCHLRGLQFIGYANRHGIAYTSSLLERLWRRVRCAQLVSGAA